MTTTEYTFETEEQADQQDEKWLQESTRYDKVEYLLESCQEGHIVESTFFNEMVSWMDEDDFTEFFKRHCSLHNILLPNALTYQMEH